MQGLYGVKFTTPLSAGDGVIIGHAGQIVGGDQGYRYTGTYVENGDTVTAKLRIERHTATSEASVFGPYNDFNINLTGSASTFQFTGTSPEVPNVMIKVALTKAPQSNNQAAWEAFLRRIVS